MNEAITPVQQARKERCEGEFSTEVPTFDEWHRRQYGQSLSVTHGGLHPAMYLDAHITRTQEYARWLALQVKQ